MGGMENKGLTITEWVVVGGVFVIMIAVLLVFELNGYHERDEYSDVKTYGDRGELALEVTEEATSAVVQKTVRVDDPVIEVRSVSSVVNGEMSVDDEEILRSQLDGFEALVSQMFDAAILECGRIGGAVADVDVYSDVEIEQVTQDCHPASIFDFMIIPTAGGSYGDLDCKAGVTEQGYYLTGGGCWFEGDRERGRIISGPFQGQQGGAFVVDEVVGLTKVEQFRAISDRVRVHALYECEKREGSLYALTAYGDVEIAEIAQDCQGYAFALTLVPREVGVYGDVGCVAQVTDGDIVFSGVDCGGDVSGVVDRSVEDDRVALQETFQENAIRNSRINGFKSAVGLVATEARVACERIGGVVQDADRSSDVEIGIVALDCRADGGFEFTLVPTPGGSSDGLICTATITEVGAAFAGADC